MRRLAQWWLVVVLCLGEVALLGSGVVAEVSDSGGSVAWEDEEVLEMDGSVGSVPDESSDAARVAPACAQTYDNGTPGDTSDDFVLESHSVGTNGDRTCVYTREVSRDVDADPVECSDTQPGEFKLKEPTDEHCLYERVPYTTRDADKSVTYSCDPRSGWSMRRSGGDCIYSKTVTKILPPDPAVYECPPVDTYRPGKLQDKTCTYTRSGSTMLPAKVTTKYRCPPNPPTFSLTDIDYNHGQCIYSRSGETTRPAQYLPMFGSVGTCPTAPDTFTYSKRVSHSSTYIVCHYTRIKTTSRAYQSYDTYTCPPAPATYSPDGRSGSTCRYKRSTSTTGPATLATPSKCPPVPPNHRWSHRSGNSCYYTMTVTETRPARSKTTYFCRSGTLVGTKCRDPRTATTRTPRVYECPKPGTREILTESGSGKSKTCTYVKTETVTITKKAPKLPPPTTLATPTGVKANGDSTIDSGLPSDNLYKSEISWERVPKASEYIVKYGVWTIEERKQLPTLPQMADDTFWNDKKTSQNKILLTGLNSNTLYIVRVQAIPKDTTIHNTSGWSIPIYTYTTAATGVFNGTPIPPDLPSRVGINYILGYLPPKHYSYTICTNNVNRVEDIPVNRLQNETFQQRVAAEIDKGINMWAVATDRMVTAKRSGLVRCDEKMVAGTDTVFVPATIVTFFESCGFKEKDASEEVYACIISSTYGLALSGQTVYVNKPWVSPEYILSEDLPDDASCSQLHRIAMHESGHAYGLADVPEDEELPEDQRRRKLQSSWDNKTVMWMSKDELCAPTEYDIVALKAIYQSR